MRQAILVDNLAMNERYRALLLAARNLFSITSLDDLVENILKYSRVMMQAEACSMFLPDRATHELILYSARGKEDEIHAFRMPWDQGLAGAAFQQKKFLRIDDAQNDPRLFRPADAQFNFVTRSMLCAPLVDRDECFGVLQAINPVDRPLFTVGDQEIFDGLTNIVTGALIRFDRELKITREAKHHRELALAQEIQRSYLPPEEVRLPGADIQVRYQPARTVGGDFSAVIPLAHDRLLIALGDVSGKGVPAALTTVQITTEMQALSHLAESGLAAYVTALNESLCKRLAAGRFAATTFLLYDGPRELMEIICAGQFAPWRWHQDAWSRVEVAGSTALGIFPGQSFAATEIPSPVGEKWLLFSDGINESRNASGEEYGVERLLASLKPGDAVTVMKSVWSGWKDFVDGENQHDDACLLLLSTRPEAAIALTSSARQCRMGRNFVEGWALAAGYPDLERGRMVLAADEAVTNIMRHTYAGAPNCKIELSAGIENGNLHYWLRDEGPPVDIAKLKGRDLSDVKPGGLGMHLLKTAFSVVEHKALPNGNLWHLAKPLPV